MTYVPELVLASIFLVIGCKVKDKQQGTIEYGNPKSEHPRANAHGNPKADQQEAMKYVEYPNLLRASDFVIVCKVVDERSIGDGCKSYKVVRKETLCDFRRDLPKEFWIHHDDASPFRRPNEVSGLELSFQKDDTFIAFLEPMRGKVKTGYLVLRLDKVNKKDVIRKAIDFKTSLHTKAVQYAKAWIHKNPGKLSVAQAESTDPRHLVKAGDGLWRLEIGTARIAGFSIYVTVNNSGELVSLSEAFSPR